MLTESLTATWRVTRREPENLLLVLLPCLFYSVHGGSGVAYVLLLLFALGRLAIQYKSGLASPNLKGELPRHHANPAIWSNSFVAAIALYCSVCIAIDLIHAEPINAYERYLVWIFAPVILLGLRGLKIRAQSLYLGAALAAMIGCGRAAYMVYVEGAYRPGPGTNNPIFFGNANILLAVACLCGLLYSGRSSALVYRSILAVGILAGLFASFLSGSKGGWISLPLLVLIFCALALRQKSRLQIATLAMITGLGLAMIFAPGSPVPERITEAKRELVNYVNSFDRPASQRDVGGSVGARLEQFLFAAYVADDYPLLGRSLNDLMDLKQVYIQQGKVHPVVGDRRFISVHNDILDQLIQRGVIGLFALISFYVLLIRHFSRSRECNSAEAKSLRLFGILMAFLLIEFGLTNPHMGYADPRYTFAFWFTVTIAALTSSIAVANEKEVARA